jgi:hypothetical protein
MAMTKEEASERVAELRKELEEVKKLAGYDPATVLEGCEVCDVMVFPEKSAALHNGSRAHRQALLDTGRIGDREQVAELERAVKAARGN